MLREVAALLGEVTAEGADWSAQISAATRLDGDLRLDSIEMAELDDLMRERYGAEVDLLGFLADLDLDEIIELRVGDLVALVTGHLARTP